MPFLGGFCPFPGRLGDNATTGWTAQQHARCCSDLVGYCRTTPFAELVVTTVTDEITSYSGANGSGLGNAPAISVTSDVATLTWPTTYTDELGNTRAVDIKAAAATTTTVALGVRRNCYARVVAPNVVEVATFGLGGPPASNETTVTVYGSHLDTNRIGSFGGGRDKRNNFTEEVPYAESWYLTMQGARGSLYSQERSGLVHVENLALARLFAWQSRLSEQLSSNANPATAGVSLGEWVEILGVAVDADDTPADIRAACAAKETLSRGPDPVTIDDSITSLLGSWYIKSWRDHGTLTSPPDWTYGPSWTTGPAEWDLGGGTWSSVRARLIVEVREPTDSEIGEFNATVGRMIQYLGSALPAYMTYDWCTGLSDTSTSDPDDTQGFRLDLDRMDYVGLS